MVMTGDFGELRPDHFHAGIDLRSSRGVAGDPVLAIARGYVYRILTHQDGYGYALFVRHTDGRQSVYAHLDRFEPSIQAWVDTIRYAREQEEVDLVLDRTLFPVERGQVIGYMGTTGRSTGVHLHLELRNATGELALDPLGQGVRVHDHSPPDIRGLKVYVLDDKLLTLDEFQVGVKKRRNVYRIDGDTLLIRGWRAGLGIAANDLIEGTSFRTGVRSITIDVDGDTVYQFLPVEINLTTNRYINAHLDYAEWIRSGAYFHRCHTLPGNRLDMYPVLKKAGLITLSRHEARRVIVTVTDKAGLSAKLEFWMRRDPDIYEPMPRTYQFRIPFGEDFKYEDADIRWQIPAGALYETTFLKYALAESEAGQVIYRLHQPETPLHRPMEVALPIGDDLHIPSDKWAVVREWKGVRYLYKGELAGKWLRFNTRHFGDYRLYVDSLAPEVRPVKAVEQWKSGTYIELTLTDDVEPGPGERNLFWNASVNGHWIPTRWNAAGKSLLIDPTTHSRAGENVLEVEVWDRMGNRTTWRYAFQK